MGRSSMGVMVGAARGSSSERASCGTTGLLWRAGAMVEVGAAAEAEQTIAGTGRCGAPHAVDGGAAAVTFDQIGGTPLGRIVRATVRDEVSTPSTDSWGSAQAGDNSLQSLWISGPRCTGLRWRCSKGGRGDGCCGLLEKEGSAARVSESCSPTRPPTVALTARAAAVAEGAKGESA